jgi:hypothetical protein
MRQTENIEHNVGWKYSIMLCPLSSFMFEYIDEHQMQEPSQQKRFVLTDTTPESVPNVGW